MSKFGALNTLQLTRMVYDLQEQNKKYSTDIKLLNEKLKLLESTEERFFKKYLEHNKELIEIGVEQGVLREKIYTLENKIKDYKIDNFFGSNSELEILNIFLEKYALDDFKDYLKKKGVNSVEDILFLTEQDLESDGVPIIQVRKLLQYTKQELEINNI